MVLRSKIDGLLSNLNSSIEIGFLTFEGVLCREMIPKVI